MRCANCGYCCYMLDVIIIRREFIRPDLVIDELPEEAFMHKPCKEVCPHLTTKDDEAFCTIHYYEWYKETPCYSHGQIEKSKDDPCRMGEYLKRPENFDKWQELKFKAKVGAL
jgi:hypothetical protein